MEPFLISVSGLLLCILLLFIVLRNKKDRKELEKRLNQDYKHPHRHTGDKI